MCRLSRNEFKINTDVLQSNAKSTIETKTTLKVLLITRYQRTCCWFRNELQKKHQNQIIRRLYGLELYIRNLDDQVKSSFLFIFDFNSYRGNWMLFSLLERALSSIYQRCILLMSENQN